MVIEPGPAEVIRIALSAAEHDLCFLDGGTMLDNGQPFTLDNSHTLARIRAAIAIVGRTTVPAVGDDDATKHTAATDV